MINSLVCHWTLTSLYMYNMTYGYLTLFDHHMKASDAQQNLHACQLLNSCKPSGAIVATLSLCQQALSAQSCRKLSKVQLRQQPSQT